MILFYPAQGNRSGELWCDRFLEPLIYGKWRSPV